MTVHARVRRFNTKDTYAEQALDNDLCWTVVARGVHPSRGFKSAHRPEPADRGRSLGLGA